MDHQMGIDDAEPVAWRKQDGAITDSGYEATCWRDKGYDVHPLYPHPPRNEWQPASEPPEDDRLVVAWGEGRAYIAFHVSGTDPHWYQFPDPNDDDLYDLDNVTHWRDIEPPTEETKS